MRQLLPEVKRFLWASVCCTSHKIQEQPTDLELGIALEQQHINSAQLLDIAMLLELLADLCPDGGYGDVEGVHGLDLGGLFPSLLSVSYYLKGSVLFNCGLDSVRPSSKGGHGIKRAGNKSMRVVTNRSKPPSISPQDTSPGIAPVHS